MLITWIVAGFFAALSYALLVVAMILIKGKP